MSWRGNMKPTGVTRAAPVETSALDRAFGACPEEEDMKPGEARAWAEEQERIGKAIMATKEAMSDAAQPVRFIDSEERRQELEGAYKLGRADALAELAQSDEWKAMVAWFDARWGAFTEWEALREKVEGK